MGVRDLLISQGFIRAGMSDRLQLCLECGKCWGHRNNKSAIDVTGIFEEANDDALTEALDKFLNNDFPEQQ